MLWFVSDMLLQHLPRSINNNAWFWTKWTDAALFLDGQNCFTVINDRLWFMACFHFSLTVPTHVSFCIWASKEAWLGAHHCLPWFIAGLGLRCRTITQIQNSNITLFNQCCWCEIRTTRNSTSYARLLGMKNYRKAFSGPNRFIQSYTHHRDSQLNHRTARLFCLPKCDLQGLSVRLIRKVFIRIATSTVFRFKFELNCRMCPLRVLGSP